MDHCPDDLDPLRFIRVGAEELRRAVGPPLFRRVSRASEAVTAQYGDEVVGVAASVPVPTTGHRDLVAWWVAPHVRHRGVGGALLRAVLCDAAPGSVCVAAPDDEAVTPMLRAYGFELDGNARWRSPLGVIRQAVRAVVTDAADRVALVRFDIGGVRFWNLPGGGIEPQETTRGALVRELHEELGFALSEAAIGPLAWHCMHWWTDYDNKVVRPDGQLERVHLVKAPTTDLEPAIGWDELASEWVIDLAWWRLEELASTTERFVNADLPGRITSIAASSVDELGRTNGSDRLGTNGVR